MNQKMIGSVAALGVVASLAFGGMALAGGEDEVEGPDVRITGPALQQASAAALDHVGEGRVTGTEEGDEESYYEVEITRDDGSQIDVQLDEQFAVVGGEEEVPANADPAVCPGGHRYRRGMRLGLILLLTVAAGACSGPQVQDRPAADLAGAFDELIAAVVAEQVEQGVAVTPRGRQLDRCPAVDQAALQALADVVGVDSAEVLDLGATVTDPQGQPSLSCPLKFADASAGALVLGLGPAPEVFVAQLTDAGYQEVPDATATGLADDAVKLFDSVTFDASRAVWLADGFQVSLTANRDLVDSGMLLQALPVAVEQVSRVLGA